MTSNVTKIKIGDDLYVVDANGDGFIDPQFDTVLVDGSRLSNPGDDYFVDAGGKRIGQFDLKGKCTFFTDCPIGIPPYSVLGKTEDVYERVLMRSKSRGARDEAAHALGLPSSSDEAVADWFIGRGFENKVEFWDCGVILSRCRPDFAVDRLLKMATMDVPGADPKHLYDTAMGFIEMLAGGYSLHGRNEVSDRDRFDIFKKMAGVEYDEAGKPYTRLDGIIEEQFFFDRWLDVGAGVDLHVAGMVASSIGLYYHGDESIVKELLDIAASKSCNVCVRCYSIRVLNMIEGKISQGVYDGVKEKMKKIAADAGNDASVRDCASEMVKFRYVPLF